MDNTSAAIGLGLIIGLTSALKMLGLPTKYAPIVSIAIGLCLFFLTEGVNPDSTILGLIAGLTASGLYSGAKATFTK